MGWLLHFDKKSHYIQMQIYLLDRIVYWIAILAFQNFDATLNFRIAQSKNNWL